MSSLRKVLLGIVLVFISVLWLACSAPSAVDFSAPEAPAADSAGMAAGGATANSAAEASLQAVPGAQIARKVVANANMTLVVADTAMVVEQIETLVEQLGGYISNTNLYKSSYGDSELLRGDLTLRIPADRLEEAMMQLTDLAVDVRAENVTREDVTDQYSDIEAQLRNLRATEDELRALLAEVREKPDATPEDIMAVYDHLTQIRGQIEQLQGRQNMLDNLVALSTVELELIPDALNQPVVAGGWRPAVVTREALRALVNTLEFLGSAAIWVGVYLLPLVLIALIPLSILIWLLRTFARRLQRRRVEGTA